MASLNSSASSTLAMAHGTHRLRKTCPPRTKIASIRRLRAFTQPPHEGTEDKISTYVGSTEYAKDGLGNRVARQTNIACNSMKADLETQSEATAGGGRERSSSPSEASRKPNGFETTRSSGGWSE
ncbi:MAG: hypothetical protein M1840_007399 [Geoglossum simile]|nr:MAG: hypothetical protein M1840_007399 [Geoglossum simile]